MYQTEFEWLWCLWCSALYPVAHDDVIKWKHFPRNWPFVRGIHRSPVNGLPAQRPMTRSFNVFFDLRLNKRVSKQSWGWWFETLPCPLWRHCNELGGIPFAVYSQRNRHRLIQFHHITHWKWHVWPSKTFTIFFRQITESLGFANRCLCTVYRFFYHWWPLAGVNDPDNSDDIMPAWLLYLSVGHLGFHAQNLRIFEI